MCCLILSLSVQQLSVATSLKCTKLCRVGAQLNSVTRVSLSVYILHTAWALKRGFVTAKAARADVYRAANSILRMAVEGRLCLCLRPPGFTSNHGRRSNLNIIAISLRLAFAALHLLFLSVRFLNVDKVTSIDSLTPWKVNSVSL